jgi:hypothetical protein
MLPAVGSSKLIRYYLAGWSVFASGCYEFIQLFAEGGGGFGISGIVNRIARFARIADQIKK